MAWLTAASDLRTLLSDGPTDKLAYQKKCFGLINGDNTIFKTFEFRRVSDFTVAEAPAGVFVDGAASPASADDTASGEFQLTTAPDDGSVVTATYYYQWFIDSELVTFLTQASNWLGLGADYLNISGGLTPAALYYAASQAYMKVANKWSTMASETYLVEDAPSQKNMGVAKTFMDLADSYGKQAIEHRNDFYSRQGQALAPTFMSIQGRVSPITPRR